MTKKQQRSALYYFAKEMGERAGRSAPVKDLIEEFYLQWKAMTPNEKAPYERKYEDWKQSLKLARNDDFQRSVADSTTTKITQSVKEAPSKSELVTQLLSDYLNQVAEATPDLDSDDVVLNEQPWYIVKFIMFCKSEVNPFKSFQYDPYYVMGELAIVEYSLSDGITNTFHTFLRQNEIPLGYRSQCMESSRDVHLIPLGDHEDVKYDYPEVYNKIREFIRKGTITLEDNDSKVQIYPPIFSLSKDLEETQFGLQFLFDRYSETTGATRQSPCPLVNRIVSLESLYVYLLSLKNCSVSLASAFDDLTAYTYDYAADTACEFHDTKGQVIHCALGICKRFCYLLSENLGSVYNISHTKRHFPVEKAPGIVGGSLKYNILDIKPKSNTAMMSDMSAKRSDFDHHPDTRSDISVAASSAYSRSVAASSKPTVTVCKSVASRWASDNWNRAPIAQIPTTTSSSVLNKPPPAREDDEPSNYSTQTFEALDHTMIPSDDWTSADPRIKSANYRNALCQKRPLDSEASFTELTNKQAPADPPPAQKAAMSFDNGINRPKGRGRGFVLQRKP